MAAITLRDVEKYFASNYVIRKLNLEIADREFVVLLGPSGCGKTTTLRAIAGLETIDTGDILIDGRPVQDLPASERDIAFVFQLFALYPHLTAFENIAFPLRATGESRDVIARRVREVAASLRIEPLLGKRPSQLSGGDMQRVAIGRALVRRPKALLMDEPIGALDAQLREDMRAELKRLHLENGTTSVYVTHDQIEAMALADRVAVMHDGLLQQVGTPVRGLPPPREPLRRAVRRLPGDERHAGRDSPPTARTPPSRSAKVTASPSRATSGRGSRRRCRRARRRARRPPGSGAARRGRPAAGLRPMEAQLIQPLGAYDIVDLKLGDGYLKARTASGFVRHPGDTVWAELDAPQVHFFDAATGDALPLGPAHG